MRQPKPTTAPTVLQILRTKIARSLVENDALYCANAECLNPLPVPSHPNRKYCCSECRERAYARAKKRSAASKVRALIPKK